MQRAAHNGLPSPCLLDVPSFSDAIVLLAAHLRAGHPAQPAKSVSPPLLPSVSSIAPPLPDRLEALLALLELAHTGRGPNTAGAALATSPAVIASTLPTPTWPPAFASMLAAAGEPAPAALTALLAPLLCNDYEQAHATTAVASHTVSHANPGALKSAPPSHGALGMGVLGWVTLLALQHHPHPHPHPQLTTTSPPPSPPPTPGRP